MQYKRVRQQTVKWHGHWLGLRSNDLSFSLNEKRHGDGSRVPVGAVLSLIHSTVGKNDTASTKTDGRINTAITENAKSSIF